VRPFFIACSKLSGVSKRKSRQVLYLAANQSPACGGLMLKASARLFFLRKQPRNNRDTIFIFWWLLAEMLTAHINSRGQKIGYVQ
jgi:hypothetical protein